jgi:hypothetical protein
VVLLALAAIARAQTAPRTVSAAFKPGDEWNDYATRILEDLPPAITPDGESKLSRYGGWAASKSRATGFFRTEKLGDRWWLIDPEGCCFVQKGAASVRTIQTPGAEAAFSILFGSEKNWAVRTAAMLHENGFNGLGGWSETQPFRGLDHPLVYTRLWNFMGTYGKQRGVTFTQPGHVGYSNDCILVFDAGFERFCDEYARQLQESKDDPWLLGHFSDNELPFQTNALLNFLNQPSEDPGGQAARAFLQSRHGAKATRANIRERDKLDFLALMANRYTRIVSSAIKKHDPNHLYLGPRLYGPQLRCPEFFKAIGPYVHVLSVNYYRVWTPDREQLAMWERESHRPVLITEWYAKGMDSGLANNGGAGWLVKTQRERGLFYQNFTLALLESKVCVGWDWFKYMDNDPEDKSVDPSNRDSNKGIVSNRYQPYEQLLGSIKELNQRSYGLVEFFDHLPRRVVTANPGVGGD